ncbi:MAG: type I-F CRISPR-associated protein Csy2 [Desulfocapsa sp.]|uniref:Type I-F CRISPR-associated protein Csy2 n=1 Tax=Desulfotalea psychrophila TaxID=84980 RepID=A0ABS3AV05_9BACT|nr:type I-F CRISPR-associated protein Csy2 [Desulfocapsa sp.]MBN4068596.1 type I-F CRISPR-associated protein Csy2 [Desulfotalea psychrophila]
MVKNILLIPQIKIHNANALSSPYTIGFPAMTAWLGAVHALERKLKETDFGDVLLTSMGVVCHAIDLQTHKGSGDYVYSIIGTGNPLIPKTKNGNPQNAERPSFVEEARCHLTVSLVIEYEYSGLSINDFTETIDHILQGNMKMAGGDILGVSPSKRFSIHDEASKRELLRRLMPGHCLLERRDLMKKAMVDGKDAIDAMLDYLKVTHRCEIDDKKKVKWTSSRKVKGWIVPIATGFHGITPLGIAKNQRDPETEHRFAESIVTLGEFVMPYRIEDLDNMLWHYHSDLEKNLYLCQQNKPVTEY